MVKDKREEIKGFIKSNEPVEQEKVLDYVGDDKEMLEELSDMINSGRVIVDFGWEYRVRDKKDVVEWN